MSRDTWHGASSAPSTLNRYTYVQNNPATLGDPAGHKSLVLDRVPSGRAVGSPPIQTAGLCVTGAVGVVAYGTASVCWVKDINGRRAVLFTYGGGNMLGMAAGAGVTPLLANGTIDRLGGYFNEQGVGGGIEVTIGANVAYSPDQTVYVVQFPIIGYGARLQIPGEGHGGGTDTRIFDPSVPPYPLSSYDQFADSVFFLQSIVR